jgi:hypothetical protein
MKVKMKTDSDLEQFQEELETEQTRRALTLKWAFFLYVLTLLAIVAAALPMAFKTGPTTATSSASDFDPNRPNSLEDLDPLLPTTTPSPAPTGTEPTTTLPSISPTPRPSFRPTNNPTVPPPTTNPTPVPSVAPTTVAPTFTPFDPNYAFKLKLFWQSGYYWQESFEEVWHCVECTKCAEYGAVRNENCCQLSVFSYLNIVRLILQGDGSEHGCKRRGDGNSANCEEGDMFWIHGCDGRGSQFNILTNPGSGYQIRLAGTDLCIQRGAIDGVTGLFRSRLLKAEKCDGSEGGGQLWAPFPSLAKFELRPLNDADKSEDNAGCVSQLHHPKNEEVISLHGCKLSRIYETRYWEEY